MLFSRDFAEAFWRLLELIEQVRNKGRNYKARSDGGMGFYFRSDGGANILWFGFWAGPWRDEGAPLWFGVSDGFPEWARDSFGEAYRGKTKRLETCWTLGWVPQEDLESIDAAEKVWQRLDPILQAISRANPGAG